MLACFMGLDSANIVLMLTGYGMFNLQVGGVDHSQRAVPESDLHTIDQLMQENRELKER